MTARIENARDLLLHQGKKILLDSGFDGLAVKDLCEVCGMAAGTFYHYFESKDQLCAQILEQDWNVILDDLDVSIASNRSLHDALQSTYEQVRDFIRQYRALLWQSPTKEGSGGSAFAQLAQLLYGKISQLIKSQENTGAIEMLSLDRNVVAQLIAQSFFALSYSENVQFDDYFQSLGTWLRWTDPAEGKGIASFKEMTSRSNAGLLLQKILDTTQTAIFWKDADRRFLGVNQAFLDYYGFKSEDDLIGKNDEDMGWHPDPDPYKNDEARVIAFGESTHRVPGRCMIHGELRDIVASKSPLYDNGRIIGLVGSFEDVTLENRQRNEIGRLTRTLEAIPAGICVFEYANHDFTCISANSYYGEMTGADTRAMVGMRGDALLDRFHPEDRQRCRDDVRSLVSAGTMSGRVYRLFSAKKNGYLWVRMEARMVTQPDGSRAAYFTYTDVDDLKSAERAAQDNRHLYELVASAAHMFVWRYDLASRSILLMDNEFTRQRAKELGIPVVVHNMPDGLLPLVSPEYRDVFHKLYDDVAAGVPNPTCEIRYSPAPGQAPMFLRIVYTTIFGADGKPQGAYGFTQNTTKEKLAEGKYNRELDYIHANTQKNLIAKGHHNLTKNKLLEYMTPSNRAMPLTLDMTYDQAYEQLISLPMYEVDRKRMADIFDRDKLIARFRAGETSFTFDYRRNRNAHTVIWVRNELRTFQEPTSGDIECFAYSYDVTEEYLERQVMNKLMDLGYDYVGILDPERARATYYGVDNPLGTGQPADDVDYSSNMKARIEDHIPPEEREAVIQGTSIETIVRELNAKGAYQLSYNRLKADGKLQRKLVQYRYLDEDAHAVFICRSDITEQYVEEQAQIAKLRESMLAAAKASEAESVFLSSMSHDMRTPLNGIVGFTDLALETHDADKRQDYLEKIRISSGLMLDLVNDVLDLSKIESGKMVLNFEMFDGEQLVQNMISTIMQSAQQKNIKLVLDMDKADFSMVRADRLRVQQLLLNLVSNAVKYTPEGGMVWLTIEHLAKRQNGCNYRVVVRDNGIGMSRDYLPHAFEAFSQEHAREAHEVQGTGLGLSIVKRIVDLMGGTISAESEKGKGTTFTLLLPMERVGGGHAHEKQHAEEQLASLAGRRVLLVEDNYLNMEIAETVLTERGLKVDKAEDGKRAVDAFAKSSPGFYDVVLMDIRMPNMDGLEATRAIRAMDRSDAVSVPIIAMTADAYKEDVDRCLAAGMNDHMSKPIDVSRLFHVIAEHIGA